MSLSEKPKVLFYNMRLQTFFRLYIMESIVLLRYSVTHSTYQSLVFLVVPLDALRLPPFIIFTILYTRWNNNQKETDFHYEIFHTRNKLSNDVTFLMYTYGMILGAIIALIAYMLYTSIYSLPLQQSSYRMALQSFQKRITIIFK